MFKHAVGVNVELLPSLSQFFVLSDPVTFWSLINSPFVVTVILGGIGVWIKEGVRRDLDAAPDVARAREAVAEKTQEVQQHIDQIASQPEPSSDFRSEAIRLVGSIKGKIDRLVDCDPDRRHHRVYERLGRYDYKVRAEALWERSMMYQETLHAVMTALTGWDAYSKGRASKKAVPREILDMLNKANKELDDDIQDFG